MPILSLLIRFPVLTLLTLLAGSAAQTETSQKAASFSTETLYSLRNVCSGLSLDVQSAGVQNGARVIAWPYASVANQQWRLDQVSAGVYRLSALHSGKLLDVSNLGRMSGTVVIQWSATGGSNQAWSVSSLGNGEYRLSPQHAPNLRLEVGGTTGRQSDLVQAGTANDSCSQRWRIEPVARPAPVFRLTVASDGVNLVHADGSPFVYLADTAWELAHRLNREEVGQYLDARRAQGFTVIQMVALAELDGLSTPNAQGNLPLLNRDPARPAVMPGSDPRVKEQYDYWDHLDYVINEAAERGMYVTLLPTWGAWVNEKPVFTPASARGYGNFLAERYRGQPVIWMLGGDRNPEGGEQKQIWRAMAAGLEESSGGSERALITYHPTMGHVSSQWFQQDSWLDFNSWQTGHCRDQKEWEKIDRVLKLKPSKPVLNAEPIYENHPVCFDAVKLGYTDATDVRNVAYWSMFAGALGYAYGHHSVWQMYTDGRQGVNGPRVTWQEALTAPGAVQMKHLKTLLEARPLLGRSPDDQVVVSPLQGAERIQAIRGNGYVLIYSAEGKQIMVQGEHLPGQQTTASWYSPRSGQTTPVGSYTRSAKTVFSPPSSGRGMDWVLVLDDASRRYPLPIGTGR